MLWLLPLFALSRRRFPTWIALLAMLMMLIAPTISRSLERAHIMPVKHVMAMEHAEHGAQLQSGTERTLLPHLQPLPGASLMEEIACGYCQLLLHVPLIFWIFTPFIWLRLQTGKTLPPPPIASPVTPDIWPARQPRAPPSGN